MAASPIQVDIKQEEQTWSRPDDKSASVAAPPTNGDAPPPSNGATSDDQRDVQQPVEAVKHERTGSSVPDTTSTSTAKQDPSQRGEKQIKVLVKSYFLITVTPVFVLSWHKHQVISMLRVLRSPRSDISVYPCHDGVLLGNHPDWLWRAVWTRADHHSNHAGTGSLAVFDLACISTPCTDVSSCRLLMLVSNLGIHRHLF